MTILIEDSPRNLSKWVEEAMVAGTATGAVFTPFATPVTKTSATGKRGVTESVSMLSLPGRGLWFDPMTHALQMSGVGDFRYYDGFDLWPVSDRGDLSSPNLINAHIQRVFRLQDELGVPHLAPTVLLNAPLSNQSSLAFEMARAASAIDSGAAQTIAGTPSFWSGGRDLDAHVGSIASVAAKQWFVSVVRPLVSTPVAAEPEEIAGLCRSVRALADDGNVHVSHGDLAALPALAAGAASIGTGWDQRQRQCSQSDYKARDTGGAGGGGWFERITVRGLLSLLKDAEADMLSVREPALLSRLGTMPAPGPKERYLHHVETMRDVANGIKSAGNYRDRYDYLMGLYTVAASRWPAVQAVTTAGAGAEIWIEPLQSGLRQYGLSEGWI